MRRDSTVLLQHGRPRAIGQLIVTVVGIIVMLTGIATAASGCALPAGGRATKPDFVQLSTAMLIEATAFPTNSTPSPDGITFDYEYDRAADHGVEPRECTPLHWSPPATQMAKIGTMPLDKHSVTRHYAVAIYLVTEQPNLNELAATCRTSRLHDNRPVPTIKTESLPNTRISARDPVVVRHVSYTDTAPPGPAVHVFGYVRGLFVQAVVVGADLTDADTQAVIDLFNDQSAKLQAI